MGYNIQYGTTSLRSRMRKAYGTKEFRKYRYGLVCVGIFAALIFGRVGLLDFLIPGDNEVTKKAFSNMIQNVREGENVKRAVVVFCDEILDSAEHEG